MAEALVVRNAGGRAVDAIRSLEVMGTIAPLHLIVIIHHTGMILLDFIPTTIIADRRTQIVEASLRTTMKSGEN